MTVLIVDSDVNDATVIKELILAIDAGITVYVVPDCSTALTYFFYENLPDIIIIHSKIEGCREMLSRIQSERHWRFIRIVVLMPSSTHEIQFADLKNIDFFENTQDTCILAEKLKEILAALRPGHHLR